MYALKHYDLKTVKNVEKLKETRLFLKAEIDAEALVSSDKKFQILTQRTQRKCDRTEEILVGLYNFKNEFLATEELIVN